MNKIRITVLCFAFILLLILLIPVLVITVAGAFALYGATKIERAIIEYIDDDELTDVWNELWDCILDTSNSAREDLSQEMEL